MGGLSELSKFLETFPPDIKEAAWSDVNGSLGYIDSTEGAVAVARTILAERQRCADRADKWAKDDLQSGEVRLAAAYIRREIMSGEK
ncbi:hypothetical protein I7G59_06655 [Sinorhizobium meliloti]|uniref:hypothetical protein n=1 Tax=Rhizobium meliloti TaxID=382 RepID=UPI0023807A1E|nr:hypothetical protein [Sinorhizobium meliloti]MDE3797015.1 hypothetical protein [Sinorhizobium meliloti]